MLQHPAHVEARVLSIRGSDIDSHLLRSNGVGELYTYLPLTQKNREQLLAVPPSSKENTDYGFSVGRAAFKFNVAVGKWTTLALRVKVNSIGHEDGARQPQFFSLFSAYGFIRGNPALG
jgi:hypothetical protein